MVRAALDERPFARRNAHYQECVVGSGKLLDDLLSRSRKGLPRTYPRKRAVNLPAENVVVLIHKRELARLILLRTIAEFMYVI